MATKGKMKAKCEAYRRAGRLQINKDLKAKKHQARIEYFAKRREEGKNYVYIKPTSQKEKNERAKKNVDRRLPIQKLDSLYGRLNFDLQRRKIAEKNKQKNQSRNK